MKRFISLTGLAWLGLVLSACGGNISSDFTSGPPAPPPPPPPPPPTLSTGPEVCTDGDAGGFACSGVDLRSRLPIDAMDGTGGNDIWGWFDALTGREYALMGMVGGITGVLFVFLANFGVLRREMKERHAEILSVLKGMRDRMPRADSGPARMLSADNRI